MHVGTLDCFEGNKATHSEVVVDVGQRLIDPVQHARQATSVLRDQHQVTHRQNQSCAPAASENETKTSNHILDMEAKLGHEMIATSYRWRQWLMLL